MLVCSESHKNKNIIDGQTPTKQVAQVDLQ